VDTGLTGQQHGSSVNALGVVRQQERGAVDFASGNSRILSDKSGGRVSGVLVTN
jgi:hypothetical protein